MVIVLQSILVKRRHPVFALWLGKSRNERPQASLDVTSASCKHHETCDNNRDGWCPIPRSWLKALEVLKRVSYLTVLSSIASLI